MLTYSNHLHSQHQGKLEMFRGQLVPCFEVPARVDHVLAELKARKLGPILSPSLLMTARSRGCTASVTSTFWPG